MYAVLWVILRGACTVMCIPNPVYLLCRLNVLIELHKSIIKDVFRLNADTSFELCADTYTLNTMKKEGCR